MVVAKDMLLDVEIAVPESYHYINKAIPDYFTHTYLRFPVEEHRVVEA